MLDDDEVEYINQEVVLLALVDVIDDEIELIIILMLQQMQQPVEVDDEVEIIIVPLEVVEPVE